MEPANENYNDQKVSKKTWRDISKGQATIITLIIISSYAYAHWLIIQNGYFWQIKLTLAFAVGVTFAYLAKIKPGTSDNLVFGDKKLSTKWSDGLCLIPCLIPALHRIGLHLGWSLEKFHHDEFNPQENILKVKHNLRVDSSNITRVNASVDFWTLKYYEIFSMFIHWFFSKNKNQILVFQDFGLKIILVVVFFDCVSLGTASVVNVYDYIFSSKGITVSSQTVQKEKTEIYQRNDGNIEIIEGDSKLVIPPVFLNKNQEDDSDRSSSSCDNTETDWSTDLVATSFELDKVGCLNFYPPNGKEVGVLFTATPTKIDGDFLIRRQYNDDVCYFSSNNNCSNFIESHLNEILIFKGSHFYLSN